MLARFAPFAAFSLIFMASTSLSHAGAIEDIRRLQAASVQAPQIQLASARASAQRPGFERNDDMPRFAPTETNENDADAQWRKDRYEAWQRGQQDEAAGWALPQDEQDEPAAPSRYRQEAAYQQDEGFDGWIDTDAGTQPLARQEVVYASKEKPGTIVIDTNARRLYFVLGNGRAMQYGIGVGKPGFEWGGVKAITRKAEWPDWRPPEQMIRRRPDLPRFMPGGPSNPMGARAMYLGSSLYRIHGSNEPETIGQAVSSGCIRMINRDVVDLYERVKVGTKVVVLR